MKDDKTLSPENHLLSQDLAPEDFYSLLDTFTQQKSCSLKRGDLVKGTVLTITKQFVFLDIDFKTEGKIPLSRFKGSQLLRTLKKGSCLEAVVAEVNDAEGFVILSPEEVTSRKLLDDLDHKFNTGQILQGTIVAVVNGGVTVDIGFPAFLPASQIGLYPVTDFQGLVGQRLPLKIVQFNKQRCNVVVSRRALLEEDITQTQHDVAQQLQPGRIVEGVVKNITDYGVFFNLGGVDGLLHKTDISWGRVERPADFFALGQQCRLIVLHFDPQQAKVSLGYKQLSTDPWKGASIKFPPGAIVDGVVKSIAAYGVFVEIAPGIEGLVHHSELSWKALGQDWPYNFTVGAKIVVKVLRMDEQARRLSLSAKRAVPHPVDEKEAEPVQPAKKSLDISEVFW